MLYKTVKPKMKSYKSKLYLAYGSNLNKRQMAVRCPDAKPVGAAMIYGWELCFRGVADIAETCE